MIYKMTLADSTDSMTFDLLEVPIADKDIEGAVDNTLVNGNVFTDYLWLKKQWTQKWALMCDDEYTQLRGFYTRQWENAEAPTYRLFYGNNVTEDVMRNGSYITENIDAPLGAEMTLTQLDGNAEQNALPSAYQAVEYIQSSGTQYIKTGLTSTDGQVWSAKITMQYTDAASGSEVLLSPGANSWFGQNGGFYAAGGAYKTSTSATTKATVQLGFGNSVTLTINGETVSRPQPTDAGEFYIFASGVNAYYQSSAKLFSCKIYDSNGTMVRNFVPCYQTSNNAIGLYDLVGRTFYANAGSGSFTKGDDVTVSPTPDSPVSIETVTGEQTVGVTGKNLASLETTGSIVGGVSFLIVDGIIHLSGTTEANKNFFFDSFRTNSGSATFWIEVTGYTDASGNSSMILQQSDDNSSWANLIEISMLSSVNKVRPVTLDSSKYYRIRWYVNSNTFTNATIKVQLEYGSTKTSFEQYQGQEFTIDLGSIELAKIGTYQDYIWNDNGVWKIHKEVGKVVYSGASDEAWTQATTSGQIYWYVGISDSMNYTRFDSSLMSDNFTYHGENDANGFYMNAHNLVIFNHGLSATTVDAWKTWLGTHNTTVYFALATPTTTEITNETLLSQLNFIANLYGGVNHISLVPSAGAQGTMEVKIHSIYEQETEIYPQTAIRLTLTDDGIINPCGCRRNVQIKMRETIQ